MIARFNLFNDAGALLGAAMPGLVGSGDLRLGFAPQVVLVLALLPLARAFVPSQDETKAQRGTSAQ